ncbi:MAG: type I-B CRISPR-associated protein Cas7/Csh2 [Thermoplasmatales archaeon]|nr:type I-B CRISPR-associated protein Cas7/Csh2 [Thermoplasmatales archaeon]
MTNIVKNRSEILFLYDIKDANPNGDPLDENKPRIDEETGINIVTDVRLKRTIRDYLHDFKDCNVFIIKDVKDDGTQKTREERIEELQKDLKRLEVKDDKKFEKEKKLLLNKYIDLRLFGATIALKSAKEGEKGRSITLTGPVQFKFGRSLHQVEPKSIKGTSVMPSKEEATQGTFIETQILPYSLICFYGIINENAAGATLLKEEDVDLLLDGLWNGTKNLITRSKVGQMPRLLLRVVYKDNNYHLGDLDRKIKLITDNNMDERAIRDISDIKLDVSKLLEVFENNKEKIEGIDVQFDEDVSFVLEEREVTANELMKELKQIAKVNTLNL